MGGCKRDGGIDRSPMVSPPRCHRKVAGPRRALAVSPPRFPIAESVLASPLPIPCCPEMSVGVGRFPSRLANRLGNFGSTRLQSLHDRVRGRAGEDPAVAQAASPCAELRNDPRDSLPPRVPPGRQGDPRAMGGLGRRRLEHLVRRLGPAGQRAATDHDPCPGGHAGREDSPISMTHHQATDSRCPWSVVQLSERKTGPLPLSGYGLYRRHRGESSINFA